MTVVLGDTCRLSSSGLLAVAFSGSNAPADDGDACGKLVGMVGSSRSTNLIRLSSPVNIGLNLSM